MKKKASPKVRVYLTEKAIRDIDEIQADSIECFGKRAANKYITELESAITRLSVYPDLLTVIPEFHSALHFYAAGRHIFVCERGTKELIILTLLRASMDIPGRLAELQPTLRAETEMLQRKLAQARKRRDRKN